MHIKNILISLFIIFIVSCLHVNFDNGNFNIDFSIGTKVYATSAGDVLTRWSIESSWKDADGNDIPIPEGYIPLGFLWDGSYKFYYIINPKSGDMKKRFQGYNSEWTDGYGNNVPIPEGYIPLGLDYYNYRYYYFIINPTTGNVLKKDSTYSSVEWVDAGGMDIPMPEGYVPLGFEFGQTTSKMYYIIIDPKSGHVKKRLNTVDNIWKDEGGVDVPIPNEYIPLGFYRDNNRGTYLIVKFNYVPVIKSYDCSVSSDNALLNLQLTVSDLNASDNLTCKYYLDDETEPRDIEKTSNTATSHVVNFKSLDIKYLTEGKHNIKFEVEDELANPVFKVVSINIDKTPPSINAFNISTSQSSINISSTASDSVSGLDTTPYKYTIGTTDDEGNLKIVEQSQWTADTSFAGDSLLPNNKYIIKFEAKDSVGNISSKEQTVYTKAQIPTVNTSEITENSLNLSLSDYNPYNTEYQIMFNNLYMDKNGSMSNSPVWITVSGKTIPVSGLSPNTAYSVKAKARNSDGVETDFSNTVPALTLASTPKNISFSPSQTSMVINWDTVPGAISYSVEDNGTTIDNITDTSYTRSGLTSDTEQKYRVRTNNGAGYGNWSNLFVINTLPNPPAKPANLSSNDYKQRYICLTWNSSVDADEYEVEQTDKNNIKTYQTLKEASARFENLIPDSKYTYRIRALKKCVQSNVPSDAPDCVSSEWSDPLSIVTWPDVPDVPVNISTRKTNVSVNILWNQSLRAESYEILVDGVIISTGADTQYLHDGLSALSIHKYRVRALNRGGASEWSQEIEVTTNPDKPSMPNNIMATADKNSITLTWYLVPYAEKYDIEIDGKDIKTATDLTYKNMSLVPGTVHSYRISARNVTGNSEWSEPITISTLPESDEAMTSLTNVVAVVTNSYITLSWDDVEKDAGYMIEVDGVLQDIGKDRVYNHTGLSANQYHTYKIKVKSNNNSEYWCSVLSLSTLPDPPDAPTGIEASATDREIQLKWNKSDNVTYDIEVDGKTAIDIGENNTYTDQNLEEGSEHSYRIRAKNITGVTAWSNAIIKSTKLPEYTVKCSKGNTFDFSILASNVQDFTGLSFVISFNENDLDIEDLCSFTPEKNLENGTVTGTNLTITREAGKIIITVKDNIVPGTSWSGELNNIIFKSKIDGETKINITVQNK